MYYSYPMVFTRDRLPDGETVVLVTCPNLPELITQGDDEANARAQASDALTTVIRMYAEAGRPLPPASTRRPDEAQIEPNDIEVMIRVRLLEVMREQRVTQVELARRMGVQRRAVQRLLDFDHRFNVQQAADAFAALGHRLDVRAIDVTPREDAA